MYTNKDSGRCSHRTRSYYLPLTQAVVHVERGLPLTQAVVHVERGLMQQCGRCLQRGQQSDVHAYRQAVVHVERGLEVTIGDAVN